MLGPRLCINGGQPLAGSVRVGGSKNAALPIMAAAIMCDAPVRIDGVARLTDVRTMAHILRSLGMEVRRGKDACLHIKTADSRPFRADSDPVRRMRAGFCVMGPLLTRRGRAAVPLPGGCAIGDRPVDLHLAGLAALGAEIKVEHGYVIARAKRLVGNNINTSGPRGSTVTGTANVLCAASLARGESVLRGAAREPEIVALGQFLIAMGARIDGLGTETIRVKGVEQLSGGTWQNIPDRIEAATLLLAVAISGGRATIAGLISQHMDAVLQALDRAGCHLQVALDSVSLAAPHRPRALDITAEPYPGIPSDIQAQWTAFLALGDGRSTIRDRVFPARFAHAAELNRLSAKIRVGDGAAEIEGVGRLSGATVTASDLRAGAALVLAGLAAEGRTDVLGLHHLDRGYENLDRKLSELGADISRVTNTMEENPR